jgi:malonate transporter MadL subunit
MIYSLVTLSLCMLLGKYIGNLFGALVGINADVGGVGFAILLLLFVGNYPKFTFTKKPDFIQGMNAWKQMYIPVVVAMAASQNVFRMLTSGMVAIIGGAAAVAFPFLLLYILHKREERRENNAQSQ